MFLGIPIQCLDLGFTPQCSLNLCMLLQTAAGWEKAAEGLQGALNPEDR